MMTFYWNSSIKFYIDGIAYLCQMSLQNDLLIRAARGEKTERTPVWVMRQAGRILSEYRATRAEAGSFIGLVKNPKLAAEVTVQPVDILGVDAAIIFSDILVIPEALGLPYQMDEGKGPHFPKTIQNIHDIEKLNVQDVPKHLKYVSEAIQETLHRLENRVPLIGFAGAPWTIFCYMIQGRGDKDACAGSYAIKRSSYKNYGCYHPIHE